MNQGLWWKILLGVVLIVLPGSMLLWPVIAVAIQRRKASRPVVVVTTASTVAVAAPHAEASAAHLASA